MGLFGDPKEKVLKGIFEGREDLLFHDDLNDLKAHVEDSIRSKHASMMSFMEEQVELEGRSVPPKGSVRPRPVDTRPAQAHNRGGGVRLSKRYTNCQ